VAEPQHWKPAAYTSLSPYLVVSGAQALIEFAQAVFGATVLRRFDRSDGSLMHAELRIDDSVLMLGDATDAYPPFPSMLHVYVPDVDDVFSRALAAGATEVEAPRTQEGDPDRRGTVKDAWGNTWAFSTQMPA
jgi:PhnB protein